ncbi:MAG: ATPase [Verrucomicrobia subdivision 6 bacterium BACL9 MAG-120924-bin69]|jgi:MoxR-like ATPase|uniref:ATPase n=2 Tax=Verrucomicrobia subdivision 6 TaxID=134627 RepID=A0A0R2RK02_9BACT|nr:MAG: ATPase [Verrucomicrobia subdivision 6 bacterium BACL9 MAG-120507-bin52]KRP34490.1 MAG: ATPase [Verrucomicrobia subdivision 6 bacterium BACL9 MAG-120924-bin69]MDA1339751.1 MoxR family ATPase [Verrucomicrobiota bacterium]HCP06162.1 ATPase [Verrucomicrobiales bacterium]
MTNGKEWAARIRGEVQKAIIGQDEVIERLLVALLANGHVLLEGLPGLAKTLLIKSLGSAMGLDFERIQFTPDLLPSDVVGTMVFQPKEGTFRVHRGPVFANLVLADEINRAPAKVQSALLEAMQERQVTIGGETHHLPKPFLVMATQNPLEQEGTYPLPEAQTDRFLFKILVDYPSEQEERAMMERWGQLSMQPKLSAVSSGEELLQMRAKVDEVYLSPPLQAYMLALVRETRVAAAAAGNGGKVLSYGASPRASLALVQSARALAWLHGMNHATPEVVQNVFLDALRHRVGLTYEAEAEETTTDQILKGVLERIPVPAGQ